PGERPDHRAEQERPCPLLRFRRRLRYQLRPSLRLENAGRPGARSPVQRPVEGCPLHRALLLRPGLQFRQEYREVSRRHGASFGSLSAAGGIWLIARSVSAQIVRLGLTPKLAAITEPSQTY